LLDSEPVPIRDDDVVHLGEGILALGMTRGIDLDSSTASTVKAIFLRQEQRDAALDAVNAAEKVRKVVLTGSAGLGKTFGTMAAVAAELLLRGYPVLRTSRSPARLQFFRRRKDGTFDAWSAPWKKNLVEETNLVQDWRLAIVTDPREDGEFLRGIGDLPCLVIHGPSDNEPRHYLLWDKNSAADAKVLYQSPSTVPQIIILCRELWNEYSQRPGEARLVGDDLDEEIRRRALLVGPFPRYITKWSNFEERVEKIKGKAEELRMKLSEETIVQALISKEIKVESGKVQTTYTREDARALSTTTREPWMWRTKSRWVINPLFAYFLESKIKDILAIISSMRGGSSFGWFFERNICEPTLLSGGEFKIGIFELDKASKSKVSTQLKHSKSQSLLLEQLLLKLTPTQPSTTKSWDRGFLALKSLRGKSSELLRLPTTNFPLADFATDSTTLFNARTTQNADGVSIVKCGPGLRLLENLGIVRKIADGRIKGKKDVTWSTVSGKEESKITLYLVYYEDVTSSVEIKLCTTY